MLPAVVIAAGRSSRMGRPKALLPFGRSYPVTFLQRITDSMQRAGVGDILVVGRPDDTELTRTVERLSASSRFIPNPDHPMGQLTSILAAVNAIDRPGVRGLMVMPVDLPLVRVETFERVLHAAVEHPRSIVRATHQQRHGHPVIFDRDSFDLLRRADPAVGAKSVMHAHGSRVVNIDVPDAGVLTDIDTVEEYKRIFGGSPESFETQAAGEGRDD
jgi:CTP:molybdopterin cytidylyltransferase MocA